jgi:hypothetical protein
MSFPTQSSVVIHQIGAGMFVHNELKSVLQTNAWVWPVLMPTQGLQMSCDAIICQMIKFVANATPSTAG